MVDFDIFFKSEIAYMCRFRYTVEPIFNDTSNSDNCYYNDRFANPRFFLPLSHVIYFYNNEYKNRFPLLYFFCFLNLFIHDTAWLYRVSHFTLTLVTFILYISLIHSVIKTTWSESLGVKWKETR